jgi:hypothetical protein
MILPVRGDTSAHLPLLRVLSSICDEVEGVTTPTTYGSIRVPPDQYGQIRKVEGSTPASYTHTGLAGALVTRCFAQNKRWYGPVLRTLNAPINTPNQKHQVDFVVQAWQPMSTLKDCMGRRPPSQWEPHRRQGWMNAVILRQLLPLTDFNHSNNTGMTLAGDLVIYDFQEEKDPARAHQVRRRRGLATAQKLPRPLLEVLRPPAGRDHERLWGCNICQAVACIMHCLTPQAADDSAIMRACRQRMLAFAQNTELAQGVEAAMAANAPEKVLPIWQALVDRAWNYPSL